MSLNIDETRKVITDLMTFVEPDAFGLNRSVYCNLPIPKGYDEEVFIKMPDKGYKAVPEKCLTEDDLASGNWNAMMIANVVVSNEDLRYPTRTFADAAYNTSVLLAILGFRKNEDGFQITCTVPEEIGQKLNDILKSFQKKPDARAVDFVVAWAKEQRGLKAKNLWFDKEPPFIQRTAILIRYDGKAPFLAGTFFGEIKTPGTFLEEAWGVSGTPVAHSLSRLYASDDELKSGAWKENIALESQKALPVEAPKAKKGLRM